MRRRWWTLSFLLVAACAPEVQYQALPTSAVVIRPRPAQPQVAARPKNPPPPTRIVRPRPETPPGEATATVVATELALPVLPLVPPTPETSTLARVLPPIDTGSELPGTLQVIASLHAPGGIAPPLSAAVAPSASPIPRGFWLWWMFPFFPFGLSRAGGP